MTGKLIRKRKCEDESSEKSTESNIQTIATTSSSSSSTTDINTPEKQQQEENAKRKKHNEYDTPDSSSDESSQSSSSKNSFLIIALQKIIELESDLNEIDNECKINGLYGEIDEEVSHINGLGKSTVGIDGNEAEALGFAMCARETLLFLQNEGVPENSLLYKALKDRLVGKSDGIPI